MNRKLARYYREIKKYLPCSQKEKRKFLSSFQKDVESYLESRSDCTVESVFRQFGAPEKIAEDFLSSSDQSSVQKYLAERKRFWTFIKVVLSVLAAAIIILLIVFVTDAWIFNHYSEGHEGPAIEGSEPEPPSGVIEIYSD